MGKRNSFFGVTLPPTKEELIGSGAATITFVLQGRVISKKNNQMAIVRKKEARAYIDSCRKRGEKPTYKMIDDALNVAKAQFIGNKLYTECKKTFLPVLAQQKAIWEQRLAEKGLKFPLKRASLTLRFYFKDRYITDTVNKQQTVQDLLVEAGIIANDDYKTINPITAESGCYKDWITKDIALIRFSCQLPKPKTKKITLTDELK